jgi:hypothetical protein
LFWTASETLAPRLYSRATGWNENAPGSYMLLVAAAEGKSNKKMKKKWRRSWSLVTKKSNNAGN